LYEPGAIIQSGGELGEVGGGISEKGLELYEFAHVLPSGGEGGGSDTDSW